MKKIKRSISAVDGNRTRVDATRRRISTKRSAAGPADAVMHFQNTSGNQAVQHWAKSGALQAKLTIGPANDIYEQEADEVANQVMRMPEPVMSEPGSSLENVQRKPG
ncbi:MAG: hypothetical protein EHM45_14295 [Desulfobacteraceae bacterium]|nr:MAG: hypothetical protein EHM45_14295 [Desulfobacteraceae bacterium]